MYLQGSFIMEILSAALIAHCGAIWQNAYEFISR